MERDYDVSNEKSRNNPIKNPDRELPSETVPLSESGGNKVKFEIWGEEMIEKKVKLSGNSGRVYLPPNWVGHNVKIIRID